MESNQESARKRAREEDEEHVYNAESFPRELRFAVRETNYKYRGDALKSADLERLTEISQEVLALHVMFTDLTWSWTVEMGSLQLVLQTTDDESGQTFVFNEMVNAYMRTMQQHNNIKLLLLKHTEEVLSIRMILDGDRPRPPIPPRQHRTIDSLTHNKAYAWTGFTQDQLHVLLKVLRIPYQLGTRNRYKYYGEEVLIMSLTRIHTAESWVSLADGKFGGDARRSSEMFEWFIDYLFETFYNAITGSSIDMWVNEIDDFRCAIWKSFTELLVGKDGNPTRFDVDLANWPIAFFLDCTTQLTCRPGGGGEQTSYVSLLQKAFYSGYVKRHGLKFQTLWAPNGMFVSVFGSSLRVQDNGMVNISGLNSYLETRMPVLESEHGSFQAKAYGDAIYSDRSCIVGRAKKNNDDEWRKMIDKQLGRKRTSVENSYAGLKAFAGLFAKDKAFKIMNKGEAAVKTSIVIFFLYNCLSCFNGNSTATRFHLKTPDIEDYLPLTEDFARKESQVIDQEEWWNPMEDMPEDDSDDED